MLIFRLDQVPEAHRRKFLALVGVVPAPPLPATTVVRFALSAGAAAVDVPAGVRCEARDGDGAPVRFRTLHDVHVVPARLAAIVATGAGPPRDLSGRLARGEPFAPFGDDPRPGAALELALDAALAAGERATLHVTGAGPRAGGAERARLTAGGALRPHHGARVVWELRVGAGRWRTLDPAAGEVADDTRALTLDGPVDIVTPEPMTADPAGRYLVRARFAGGAYDAPPRLRDVSLNAVAVEQAVEDAAEWPIASG